MPSYRIGFGSDFNLRDAKVGIGTTLGRTKLDVAGVSKADFNIAGVTTLTSYGGFVGQKQNITKETTTGFSTTGVGTFVQVNETQTGFENLSGDFNTVSEDIIVDEGKIFQVSSGSTVSVGTLESVSVGAHFSVPKGGSSARQEEPIEGSVRFNDDLNTLEFYNGIEWRQFTVTGASGRGVIVGGVSPTWSNIEYINFSTLGNSLNFGTLTAANHSQNRGSVSSSTRGLFCGGNDPAVNTIEYITIASEGNAIDFGDISLSRQNTAGGSSSTRGINAGGYVTTPAAGTSNVIDYVQINTLGNAIDFGDLYVLVGEAGGATNPTRMVIAGGYGTGPSQVSTIQFINIASTGNSVFFGNLIQQKDAMAPMNSSTRGVFAGSELNFTKTIEYITIASAGNASDFGELSLGRGLQNGMSSQTRGIIAGGYTGGANIVNIIEYITIASTGNAQDFGDLIRASRNQGTCSDSHGGLGGF